MSLGKSFPSDAEFWTSEPTRTASSGQASRWRTATSKAQRRAARRVFERGDILHPGRRPTDAESVAAGLRLPPLAFSRWQIGPRQSLLPRAAVERRRRSRLGKRCAFPTFPLPGDDRDHRNEQLPLNPVVRRSLELRSPQICRSIRHKPNHAGRKFPTAFGFGSRCRSVLQ